MTQREALTCVDGTDYKIVYHCTQTHEGVVYAGFFGKLPFSFSRTENNLVFSDSLADLSIRKAVIAAVFDNEDRHQEGLTYVKA